MAYGALGTMQYDVGRGVFRRGGHGGGIFDGAMNGLGRAALGQMTSEAVSWIGGGSPAAPTSWGTDEAELAAQARPPAPVAPAPVTTVAPKPKPAPSYTPVTTSAAAAAPVMMQPAGMSSRTKALLLGGGAALLVVYYLHKKGKL